jgi:hypothetical protein
MELKIEEIKMSKSGLCGGKYRNLTMWKFISSCFRILEDISITYCRETSHLKLDGLREQK